MSRKATLPVPVQDLQRLSKDLLKSSAQVGDKLCWCKSGSRLGWDQRWSVLLSGLVKRDVLGKILVDRESFEAKKFPKSFFFARYGGLAKAPVHVYVVLNKEQIEILAKDPKSASEWLGRPVISPSQPPASFEEGLAVVKKAIAEHPDPAGFAISVIKQLCS